jgi:copper homeostasis protein CutC
MSCCAPTQTASTTPPPTSTRFVKSFITPTDLESAEFVFDILHADGAVDVERTRTLVDLAGPLETTFHRAFDATPDLAQALEDVIAAGCHRILTSGGAPDVLTGADALARLVTQAADRIQIAAGGGLRLENAQTVARIAQARHFHGSLRQPATNSGLRAPVSVEDIRRMTRILQEAGNPGTTTAGPASTPVLGSEGLFEN